MSAKLALTSPTSGGRSVGIVRSRNQNTEFIFFVCRRKWSSGLVIRVFVYTMELLRILSFLWGTIWIYICYVEESRSPLWSSSRSSWLLNWDVLWFLWGTNAIYICYVGESRPPLCSSGQNSWLKVQRSGLDSQRYQIFWEVVDLNWGPLSLVSTIEEILGRKSSGSGLKNRDYGRNNSSRWPRVTLYPQKLVLTSPTSDGR
jgi:hypothetical protein